MCSGERSHSHLTAIVNICENPDRNEAMGDWEYAKTFKFENDLTSGSKSDFNGF